MEESKKHVMDDYEFLKKAKLLVAKYIYEKADKNKEVPLFDIHMVGYGSSRKNTRIELITSLNKYILYVVEYDSNKNELYFRVHPATEEIVYNETLSPLRGKIL